MENNKDKKKKGETMYEESRKEYWDTYSILATAENKGRAEGRADGLAEGRAEERLANARSLKSNGGPLEVIIMSLGLTAEEIEKM